MKFRAKMILAYATIALVVSLFLGFAVYQTSARYEQKTQRSNLVVSARSYVTQMDDRLGRMNAILYYILSDASMLDGITMLGRASGGTLPDAFVREAQNAIISGISTEYIMQNSYRTVFFNQDGFFTSSAVKQSGPTAQNQRMIESFEIEQVPYLDPVIEAEGRSVIVGPHTDFWGAYGNVQVYSLMKAPRGEGMGFLEAENRLDSLAALASSDPDVRFLIFVNDGELLYDNSWDLTEEKISEGQAAEQIWEAGTQCAAGETLTLNGRVLAKSVSDQFNLTVITYKPVSMMYPGRNRIFLTSFLSALAAFAVSLIAIIFFSSRLTHPVMELQKIVEETNIENLQDRHRMEQIDRIDGRREPDEFAGLARSYQAMTSRLNTALQNEKRSAMLQLQAQFDTLQTQVNPHFIYNVLNVISSRAIMDDDEVICEMCGCLGNMLRYSTNNKARYAKVEEELEYLNSYFYLLKSRYEDRLQVVIDIEKPVRERIIPKMTLQQIVENCIKHGYHETDVHMEITLTGREEDGSWFIAVRDNGTGVSHERLLEIRSRLDEVKRSFQEMEVPTEAEIGGIGLTNTYARCLLLFRDQLIFEMGNVPEGTGFEVKVGQKA